MYLVTSWRESLAMLKPSNIKLLLLVSIKASMQVYVLLLKYWWWLLALIALGDIVLVGQLLMEPAAITYYVSVWWMYAYFFLKAMLWFVIFLCARSSIKNKNMQYFVSYIIRFFWISLLGGLLIFSLLGTVFAGMIGVCNLDPVLVYWLGIWNLMDYLIVLYNFFLLDRGRPRSFLKAFVNALYMIVLNVPFVVVSFIFFNLILQLIKLLRIYLVEILPWSVQLLLQDILLVVVSVIFINIISTFYIKRAHDQWQIYSPK